MSAKKLILVDGMAVLYRAFFAIRELSTSSGRPVNAVFGLIRMLRQMRNKWEPTHWAVIFDGGLPKERVALLDSYKAQRAPMPDDLRGQINLAEDYLDRALIRRLRVEGQEADDVMASLAIWAEQESSDVLIATNDKDLYQVVNEKISIIAPSGKQSAMGPEDVKEKTGVNPDQIVDWLALTGDSADNIPGVPGVGPKTAAKLLAEYGKIASVWENIEQIKRDKLRVALKEYKVDVERNIQMVRLYSNLDCGLSWNDLEVKSIDPDRLLPFFEEMEFTSMARELREPDLFSC
ncbi:MAG: hypothetical protein KAH23_07845 [Kiritimatiellae bacterium]|nr:hypothetical protein [Kiritimatiellia bacterium]